MNIKFAIYSSGNSSTILNFYNKNKNLEDYKPALFIYDGNNNKVKEKIKLTCSNYYFIYEEQNKHKSKIHTFTSNFIHKLLDKYKIDYILCFGDKIFKKNIINSYKNKIINFHPSILPAFRGLKSIDQALTSKSCFLGTTAHYIDEGIDTGEIIGQVIMKRKDYKEYNDIYELNFILIKHIFKEIFKLNNNIDIFEDINHNNYISSFNT